MKIGTSTEEAGATERPLSAVRAEPVKLCGNPTKRGDHHSCRRGKGQKTNHPGFGQCNLHYGNTPNGIAHAERERQVAEKAKQRERIRALIEQGKNVLGEFDIDESKPDAVAVLEEMLQVARRSERFARVEAEQREMLYGPNHLADDVPDVTWSMHVDAVKLTTSIAKELAAATTGTKITVETRFASFAKYSDEELDAAIAEAESIVHSARKGQPA